MLASRLDAPCVDGPGAPAALARGERMPAPLALRPDRRARWRTSAALHRADVPAELDSHRRRLVCVRRRRGGAVRRLRGAVAGQAILRRELAVRGRDLRRAAVRGRLRARSRVRRLPPPGERPAARDPLHGHPALRGRDDRLRGRGGADPPRDARLLRQGRGLVPARDALPRRQVRASARVRGR